MDERFLPPVDFIDGLNASWTEKKKAVTIGSGIIMWGLHGETITPGGAEWLYSIFGIEELELHDFFTYKALNKLRGGHYILERGSTILYSSGVATFAPEGFVNDIKRAISINGRLDGIGYINDSDIKVMLKKISEWAKKNPKIDGTHIRRILPGVLAVERAKDGVVFKSIIQGKYYYIGTPDIEVVGKTPKAECDCGTVTHCCIKKGDQVLCRKCLALMNNNEPVDCMHWECGYMECENYCGEDFGNEDIWRDDEEEEEEEFKKVRF